MEKLSEQKELSYSVLAKTMDDLALLKKKFIAK